MFRLRFVPDDTKIAFMKGRIAGLVTSAVLSITSVSYTHLTLPTTPYV